MESQQKAKQNKITKKEEENFRWGARKTSVSVAPEMDILISTWCSGSSRYRATAAGKS